jgi:hypothetical protein
MSAPAAVVATGADVSKNAANPVLALKEADLRMMLAAKVHLGTKVRPAAQPLPLPPPPPHTPPRTVHLPRPTICAMQPTC